MDINELRIFKTVAEAGSVTEAARRLDYAQSNVTARLRHLEQGLDTPLFYRKKRGMILTPAGKTLLAYAERILRLVEEAQTAVREKTKRVQGTLTIGSIESTAAVRLPPVLAHFHRAYPDVEMTLVTGLSEELLHKTLAYDLDGAFIAGRVEHPELEQMTAFEEELVFVTAPQVESLETLEQRTLLVFRQGCTYRARLEQLFRERGLVPFKVMDFGALDAILGCVAAGMGVTLFPRSVVTQLRYADDVRLHPISAALARMPTTFVRRRDTITTRALTAFLGAVQAGNQGC